jgi:hypothetical protein
VVFCPPIATFADKEHARERDIVEGLALSVECDSRPRQARRKLEALLGPCTFVVRSGGVWIDPATGETEDKLHLHWRLQTPARGEELKALKQARDLAARIVGGDPSNKPICHPVRWPGSWHRKGEPILCRIDTANPDTEIDLTDALGRLTAAHGEEPKQKANGKDHSDSDGSWEALVQDVISGGNYHQALVVLAAKALRAGMKDGAAVNLLRALMESSVGPRDERWQARYADIPRSVSSAREKIGEATAEAAPDQETAATPASLDEWDAGDDTDPIPPRGWLLANQFCRRFLSSILAPGGTGKTALRMLQYIALATGRPLTGQHVFRRSRVLMLGFEDDRDEMRRRIRAVCMHHGVDQRELKGWLFCCAPKGVKLAEMRAGTRQIGLLEKLLREAIGRRKPDVIGFDPFIRTHALEENDNSAMDFVCDILIKLGIEYDVAIDAPHHTRKGTLTPGDADTGRGASGMRDAARLVSTLTVMTEDEARMFDVVDVERFDYVRLDPAKVNIARRSQKATWFRLVNVRLDNGTRAEDGSPGGDYPDGDNVQTVEPWAPPELWADLSTQALNAALSAIDAGLPNGHRYSDASAARERAAWVVVQRHCPNKSEMQCREIIRAWVKSGLLYRDDYEDPVKHEPCKGLRVDASKRPG